MHAPKLDRWPMSLEQLGQQVARAKLLVRAERRPPLLLRYQNLLLKERRYLVPYGGCRPWPYPYLADEYRDWPNP